MKPKLKRGSTATYEGKVDLVKLAESYSNYGNVPKTIGDLRAAEIALLSRMYLHELKCRKILERQVSKLKSESSKNVKIDPNTYDLVLANEIMETFAPGNYRLRNQISEAIRNYTNEIKKRKTDEWTKANIYSLDE